ncbi:MAG: hypothetical protein QOF11_1345, partial [Chloroflexota bacterium]|nr:hypothetical protein [Chloroflexota bacterium]
MTQRAAGGPVDFDLHGYVGVRLLGATSADARAVRRQLGPIERPLDRPAEIEIEYVDRIETDGPLRFVGRDDAAFDRWSLVLLRGRFKASVRVAIPLDRVGGTCRIVAERGVGPIPLLLPMINLTALGRGLLPIHASAFVHGGRGVLVTGWAKGGKSEVLLAFAERGAAYVGDEWVYLADDGARMVGLPEPIRLWDWQLRAMPAFAARVSRGQRLRLASTRALGAVMGGTAGAPVVRRTAGGRTLRRLRPFVDHQLDVQIPPAQLFDGRVLPDGAPLDRLVFVESAEGEDTVVEPIAGSEVARRMVHSIRHEWLDLWTAYLKWRYAFPERP